MTMAKHRLHRTGQSIVETAVLLAVVAVSLVLFVGFIRDSAAARIKSGVDTFGHGMLYRGN